ncbi:MAG: hypothetical protein OEY22_02770 [Candidatus Bathyarchaeota archaeon]|nr:hypothetical protein [Candidatus Bathyarchaeota archaeon]MDH5788276.1 hypothetical protein [Candidatus Bathyarchaeota archaeon]
MHPKVRNYPALFHNFRRRVFLNYEEYGYDKTDDFIQNSGVPAHIKAGLKAEVLFYDRYFRKFKLEPLLDARVKADFSGDKSGKFVNFDVTTNVKYKDIDDYLEVVQKRGKPYEIVLVDLKNEDFEFFPLKFPICPKCGKFSHYIIYLDPPSTTFYQAMHASDGQTLVQYCGKCKYFKNIDVYTYEVHSVHSTIETLSSETDVDGSRRYSDSEIQKVVDSDSISIRKFFEKTSNFIVSGVAENDYVITDPRDGDGYYSGLLHWKHPLAHDLSKYIDIYSGTPEIPAHVAKQMFDDFKCKLCGNTSMRFNSKKKTLTCRRCGLIHDVSGVIHTHGYEVKRVEKPK